MKKIISLALLTIFVSVYISCDSKKEKNAVTSKEKNIKTIQHNKVLDSTALPVFYTKYPKLNNYESESVKLYEEHQNAKIWFDEKGLKEFAHSLYSRYLALDQEGIETIFPYQNELKIIFHTEKDTALSLADIEIMLTNLYLFYADQVIGGGLDEKATNDLGWLLPRKQISYTNLLDSILRHPKGVINKDELFIKQYYKLRNTLKKYREIEKNGGWPFINIDADFKSFKKGDSASAIGQMRNRLFITGDIDNNNESNIYDNELKVGLDKYLLRNGFNEEANILQEHIAAMNVPVGDRIKNIMVNMERCRWILPEDSKKNEFIIVNIPAFYVYFFRDYKKVFESPVVVGKKMHETVIFSGKMSYIVFSPYWNLPTSIINKDVKPGMAKNPNYLADHRMEWNNGNVRQIPGRNNSLGLVKFIFPNSNSIYLHDTPAKSLFGRESRAFSHGCVRVGKPRDLAVKILENDKNWTPAKIDAAMSGKKETTYVLKNKIPVYIGYFTSWVKDDGSVNFYKDIYKRDKRLASLIFDQNK